MDKNTKIVKELNNFLKGINMGYDTFKIYQEKTNDTNLKGEFTKILSTFSSQKEIVISYIENLNGDAKDSLGIGGEIASMFEKVKDIFINDNEEILKNAMKSMDMGIKESNKVIKSLENITSDKSMIESLNDMVNEYKAIDDNLYNLYNLYKK